MFNYDEAPTYYCTVGALPRPMCGSVAMGEQFREQGDPPRGSPDDPFDSRLEAWEEWSNGRKVGGSCVCNSFVKGELVKED